MAERSIFNVDQFKAAMVGGGTRANQFFVALSFPTWVIPGNASAPQASFLCNAASLPGSVVNPAIVQYRGREVKFAGERIFQPWTVSIYNDVTFSVRNSFESWMNGMNGLKDNYGYTAPFEYQSNLAVTQMDRNNQPLKMYTIYSAFPIDLSEIQLNYGDNDTIETFNVTFQYQHFETDFVTFGVPSRPV